MKAVRLLRSSGLSVSLSYQTANQQMCFEVEERSAGRTRGRQLPHLAENPARLGPPFPGPLLISEKDQPREVPDAGLGS